jgi:hypothetical protein
MVLPVDDIVAKFPMKTITVIRGEPNYASKVDNMATLDSSWPPSSMLHFQISETPSAVPADPGAMPNHTVGASAVMQEQQGTQHKEVHHIYHNHGNTDDALKAQVIDTINDAYLCEMHNKYTGCLGITTQDLFDHLLDRYSKITPADIKDCKRHMNEPIDSTQPINIFFQKINESVQYAGDRQVAFTTDQILQTMYHAVSTSGYYNHACKDWHKKLPADKTWNAFKRFFASEYHNLKEQQKVNMSQTNFHGANAAVDILQALDKLAFALRTDCDITAQLTTANLQLMTTDKFLNDQLKQALANLVEQLGTT